MSETSIIVKLESNGIGRITLNKPEVHNAFDEKLIALLTKAFEQLDNNDKVKLIVLDANGKSFSAGADLNWMKKMAEYSWEQNYQDSLQLASLMQTIYQCKKTTIAVVQGSAFGGGVGLVACCDIVLASDKAKFCLSEVKLGLIPAVISPYVVKAIGERHAKRYFITAELFDVSQAAAMNLVHQIYSHDELQSNVKTFIQSVLNNGPKAMHKAKRLIEFVKDKPIEEDLIRETAQRIADTRASKEGKEGVSAFLEKRQPDWQVCDVENQQNL
ncbi:enoyl-CoA hydratase/isomerase family protein [Aliikangiella maris]|uniref:Enoyl-CoA hydratase/isomerase family protein n=2 Tax=Aliikangiella maris TaxID=3162458 RepID=A0ABV2BPN0_9GAMM